MTMENLSNKKRKSTVLLEHPLPNAPKGHKKPTLCAPLGQNQAPPPIATNIGGIMFHPYKSFHPPQSNDNDPWKKSWMDNFDQCRKQQNTTIDQLKEGLKLKETEHAQELMIWKKRCYAGLKEIEELKSKNKGKLDCDDKQSKAKIKTKNQRTQTETKHTETKNTGTDDLQLPFIDKSTQTGAGQLIDNESQTDELQPSSDSTQPINHQCSKCFKVFKKKSSLDDHMSETACAGDKQLDWQCEVCNKMFTYRGLRVHISQYVTQKHAARGEHGKLTNAEHQTLLQKHKLMKPN